MKNHIYIYSPSGAVRDKAAFRRGVARLQSLGYDVEVDVDALASHQRFAGDDPTRVQAIQRACDSGAAVALISRGGYGITRILSEIPYRAVAHAIERGTQFVGISDFTAFQMAVLAKTGASTWAGPALCEGFGVDAIPDDIMESCFNDMAQGQGEGAGWRLPKPHAVDWNADQARRLSSRRGIIWGGNLTVLTSLLGTPFFPAIRSGILFLEDVAEHPYRIERMLSQLLHAGVLARQKAILLGHFTDFQLTAHDKGFKLSTVVQWLRSQLKVPVFTQLPYGHIATKVLLPVGRQAKLLVEDRDALLYWG
ncbi:MAG: LD-carboxypeptidase [Rhodoferax sp.]|nr:LD-carboxypeptidase [Rhodoferax sp.]